MTHGIHVLRNQRGPQYVTFDEIADHLFDYIERNPNHAGVADRIARFLADVELVPHRHDADPNRGLPAPGLAADSLY